jgi:hypothetical protein
MYVIIFCTSLHFVHNFLFENSKKNFDTLFWPKSSVINGHLDIAAVSQLELELVSASVGQSFCPCTKAVLCLRRIFHTYLSNPSVTNYVGLSATCEKEFQNPFDLMLSHPQAGFQFRP